MGNAGRGVLEFWSFGVLEIGSKAFVLYVDRNVIAVKSQKPVIQFSCGKLTTHEPRLPLN